MDKPYIFISYAHSNQDKVRADAQKLCDKGWNLWLDESNMVGGKPVEQTDDIIRYPNCKAVLFYMCEKSICSQYCLNELRVAKKYKSAIIPIHCFPVSGLEETIWNLQRNMESSEGVKISDKLVSEILKTKSGSEVIRIPYDAPLHVNTLVDSLNAHGADTARIYAVEEAGPQYEETEFYKQTGYSRESLETVKGRKSEYRAFINFEKYLPGYKKFMFGFVLPSYEAKTTQIDMVVLHKIGIFVVESKLKDCKRISGSAGDEKFKYLYKNQRTEKYEWQEHENPARKTNFMYQFSRNCLLTRLEKIFVRSLYLMIIQRNANLKYPACQT